MRVENVIIISFAQKFRNYFQAFIKLFIKVNTGFHTLIVVKFIKKAPPTFVDGAFIICQGQCDD